MKPHFKPASEIEVMGKRCSDMTRVELLNAVEQINCAFAMYAASDQCAPKTVTDRSDA